MTMTVSSLFVTLVPSENAVSQQMANLSEDHGTSFFSTAHCMICSRVMGLSSLMEGSFMT